MCYRGHPVLSTDYSHGESHTRVMDLTRCVWSGRFESAFEYISPQLYPGYPTFPRAATAFPNGDGTQRGITYRLWSTSPKTLWHTSIQYQNPIPKTTSHCRCSPVFWWVRQTTKSFCRQPSRSPRSKPFRSRLRDAMGGPVGFIPANVQLALLETFGIGYGGHSPQ